MDIYAMNFNKIEEIKLIEPLRAVQLRFASFVVIRRFSVVAESRQAKEKLRVDCRRLLTAKITHTC